MKHALKAVSTLALIALLGNVCIWLVMAMVASIIWGAKAVGIWP